MNPTGELRQNAPCSRDLLKFFWLTLISATPPSAVALGPKTDQGRPKMDFSTFFVHLVKQALLGDVDFNRFVTPCETL